MKKIAITLFCTLAFLMCGYAQSPTIGISAQRLSDTTVDFKVAVKIPAGTKLYTTKKKTEDDLASTLTLDTSLAKYIHSNIKESGKLQTEQDTDIQMQTSFYTDSVTFGQILSIPSSEDIRVKGAFTWMEKIGNDFPTGDTTFSVAIVAAGNTDKISQPSNIKNTAETLTSENTNPLNIFWVCFLAGLVMVFTPCVFPLIPVTVSFFLKKSASKTQGIRNALWYSISIILIYTIPTFAITAIFGQDTMYKIATSVAANILFFAIFIVFAISFFGAFELALPNSWANKADEKSSKGGLPGIFFMALTLVIVSFSCTGPIVGTLLAQVSGTSAKMAPVLGMLGLSAGLAIPFSLFAFFPSLLKSLPKSGGWLNSVKVVFGFVELALAMKFLSNVDLIYGWHLLDREIFLVIWIVLSLLAGMYLLGKIKFSHDSELKYVSIPRLFFAIAFFCFGLYLIPGLWGAPLKKMSGLLPPPNTQDFDLNQLQYKIAAGGSGTAHTPTNSVVQLPKLYTDKLHDAPFGLTTYYDLDEGIAAAKALNKPIMLDFTGHSCTNCRKMENEVWSNPEVLDRLRNNFVIISLYTDEYSDLPSSQVYKNKDGKEITTLGEKAKDYEVSRFGLLSQPLYMFMDTDEKLLSDVKYGYDSDIEKFKQHLDNVKNKYEAEKK
ncbi:MULTISPECIES: protein-disulfide reductase DsbD family protein [Chitinophagaceae]